MVVTPFHACELVDSFALHGRLKGIAARTHGFLQLKQTRMGLCEDFEFLF